MTIRADPNPIVPERGRSHGATTLTWTVKDVDAVEIRVGAPDGPLLARGGSSGVTETGEWVGDWTTFFLQDVSGARPLTLTNTLGSVCVRVRGAIRPLGPDETWRRERQRLEQLPKDQRTTTTLFGPPFEILDAHSFLTMYDEIFGQGILAFDSSRERPYIIDCGAHTGVSVFYFKQLFPLSRILAFEPDSDAFAALARNVEAFGWKDVTLLNEAVADRQAVVPFVRKAAWDSRIARPSDHANVSVHAVRLRDYINEPVDLLKLDVEGAETCVLLDSADCFHLIDRIVVEFHSFADEPQTLDRMLGVMTDAGYRLYIRSVSPEWPLQPFLCRPIFSGMDMQLYIYAFREQSPVSPPEPR